MQGAKLSVAGRRSNNGKMSRCCCTQSSKVHYAGELFHSAAAFQLKFVGLSRFTKLAFNLLQSMMLESFSIQQQLFS
jgi:hypothetical protein